MVLWLENQADSVLEINEYMLRWQQSDFDLTIESRQCRQLRDVERYIVEEIDVVKITASCPTTNVPRYVSVTPPTNTTIFNCKYSPPQLTDFRFNINIMAGKKKEAGEGSKKAQGQARKAAAEEDKKAAKGKQVEQAEADEWGKGVKDNSKKYVLSTIYYITTSSLKKILLTSYTERQQQQKPPKPPARKPKKPP
jgi:hypothetical protein